MQLEKHYYLCLCKLHSIRQNESGNYMESGGKIIRFYDAVFDPLLVLRSIFQEFFFVCMQVCYLNEGSI